MAPIRWKVDDSNSWRRCWLLANWRGQELVVLSGQAEQERQHNYLKDGPYVSRTQAREIARQLRQLFAEQWS